MTCVFSLLCLLLETIIIIINLQIFVTHLCVDYCLSAFVFIRNLLSPLLRARAIHRTTVNLLVQVCKSREESRRRRLVKRGRRCGRRSGSSRAEERRECGRGVGCIDRGSRGRAIAGAIRTFCFLIELS